MQRVKALQGLTIGVTGAGAGTHQIAQYILKQFGMDPERDVTFAFVGSGANMIAALKTGNVDVIIGAAPTPQLVAKEMDAFTLISGTQNEYPGLEGQPFYGVITSGAWAEEHPELARRFMAAMSKGTELLTAETPDPELLEAVRTKFFPQTDKDVFEAAWLDCRGTANPMMAATADGFEKMVAFMEEFDDKEVTIGAADVFTEAYLPK